MKFPLFLVLALAKWKECFAWKHSGKSNPRAKAIEALEVIILETGEQRAPFHGQLDFRSHLLTGPKADDFEIDRSAEIGRPVDLESS